MQFDVERIKQLTDLYGSPLYVFDEDGFIRNYRQFDSCLKNIYSNYKVSYSYKTNYAPYIGRLIRSLGGYAEVVSDMELSIARKVGNEDRHIVYNGPCKETLLEEFILNGGMVNVDNFEELKRILSFAENNLEKNYRFGLRCNIDIGQGFVSRFGIDEPDLKIAFEMVRNVSNAEIVGIHCHIGRSRGIEAWKNRATRMIEIADNFFAVEPEYISLGSGMFGEMDPILASQFGSNLPTYEEYADAVARPFADHYSGDNKPVLFTEPGTTLINKYISFISKVLAVKHIKGKTFVVLDGGKHNMGEICELKKLPIQVVNMGQCCDEILDADFVGYTCLEHDVMYKGYNGKISAGDYVLFDNVGGYSNVSKPPFIKPNCCMISSNGKIIKRAETIEEVICTYE